MDSSALDRQQPHASRVTPTQVIALGLVAASIAWGVWLLRDRPTSEEVELLPGTVLPSSELAIVEAAFDRAQLAGHRTEEGRVWVPRPRQSAYMRALVDAEALPREFGSSLRKALERNSPWQSRAAQEELLRVAVQEELAHVICSMPGIERAAVLYDVEDRASLGGGLGGAVARTASVNVRTHADTELEPARIQAIRVLVAASIAGLAPEHVAVTDLRSGRVHAGPLEQPADADADLAADPALARRVAHERHLAAKVRQGLAFVKGVVVDVTVTFPPDAAAVAAPPAEPGLPARQQRVADVNAPAEVAVADDPQPRPLPRETSRPAAESPEAIVVSLAVPDAWFENAVRSARATDAAAADAAIDRREEERLRAHVLQLLPADGRPDARRVVITRFPVAVPRSTAVRQSPAATAQAASPASAPAPSAKPRSLGNFVDVTIQAIVDGRLGDVPREAWMVLTAKCSAILAYILYRGGSRNGQAVRPPAGAAGRRRSAGRIDWSAVDGHESDDVSPPRMAA